MPEQTPDYISQLELIVGNKALKKALEYYTRDIYQPPENPRVLAVGCEHSADMKVLIEFFGGVITGINIEREYIDRINEDYADTEHTFVHGDARKLREIVEPGFDVVVVRNNSPHSEGQRKMFRECYLATKEGGIIVTTCHHNLEFPLSILQMVCVLLQAQ